MRIFRAAIACQISPCLHQMHTPVPAFGTLVIADVATFSFPGLVLTVLSVGLTGYFPASLPAGSGKEDR